MILLVNTLPL